MHPHKKHRHFVKPVSGIAVDCSTTGGNPGFTECRGIDIETGEIVFDEKIGIATNNLGELFAICYAAEYVKDRRIIIYSDSKIAINWFDKRVVKTNIFRDYPRLAAKNPNLATLIEEAQDIMNVYRPRVTFWEKHWYGENIADYGRK